MYRRKMHINGPKSGLAGGGGQMAGVDDGGGVIGMKIQQLDVGAGSVAPIMISTVQGAVDDGAEVERLIQAGHSVHQHDRNKATALHFAAEQGYVKCTAVLIKHKADVNAIDNYSYCPLIRACRSSQLETFKMLLNAGADPLVCTERKQNAMHFCAMSENISCLDVLLNHPKCKELMKSKDQDGYTPLLSSLLYIHPTWNAAIKLIDAGANVKAKDCYGLQALHYAATNSNSELVTKLLDKGVDVDAPDKNGCTPFVMAIRGNNPSTLKTLIARGCDTVSIDGLNATALSMCTLMNHPECVQILLDNNEDPDDLGYFGQTSLMGASYQSNLKMVNILLAANADPNIVSRQGTTALINAVIKVTPENAYERHEVVKRIIRAGADVNYRVTGAAYFTECTNGRNCPLSFCIASGYLSLVNILMNAGGEVSPYEIDQWKNCTPADTHAHFYNSDIFLAPLKKCYQNPRNLKHICRHVIRNAMGEGTAREQGIQTLQIPKLIKDYLNFSDLDSIKADDGTCVSIGDNPGIYQPTPVVMACGLQAIEREFGFNKFSLKN